MDPFVVGGVTAVLVVIAVAVWVKFEHRKIRWDVALSSTLLAAIIALSYGEFGPGGGNMWWRLTSDGTKKFNLGSVFTVLFSPLDPKAIWLWSPEWWMQNVFVLTPLILISSTYLINKYT
jgi:hypothetical protein